MANWSVTTERINRIIRSHLPPYVVIPDDLWNEYDNGLHKDLKYVSLVCPYKNLVYKGTPLVPESVIPDVVQGQELPSEVQRSNVGAFGKEVRIQVPPQVGSLRVEFG